MQNNKHYITKREEFDRLFNLAKPYMGWKKNDTKIWTSQSLFYFEYHIFLGAEGSMPIIHNLCKLANDKEFYFLDLSNTKNLNDFHKTLHFYPLTILPSNITEDDYLKILNYSFKNVIEPIFTDEYGIFAPSLSWFIYGDYVTKLGRLVANFPLPKNFPKPSWRYYNEIEAKEHLMRAGLR